MAGCLLLLFSTRSLLKVIEAAFGLLKPLSKIENVGFMSTFEDINWWLLNVDKQTVMFSMEASGFI